ncbi:MAG: VCBS repeat-containing protein [Verrucomicrobiae bacterium]|nr:VCBS repeat-containing protein [Verrucomicrobiae bacterium]
MNPVGSRTLPCLLGAFSILANAGAGPAFDAQTLDAEVEIGYGVAVADVDGDGLADVLLADRARFSWYRNPDWSRHDLAKNLTLRDNVCLAAADIDGDGKAEIAVGGQWNPGETTDRARSGSVHFLVRPADPRALWTPVPLFHDPTVHRMRWVRTRAGDFRLIVLPLHGIGNVEGEGTNGVNLRAYLPPGAESRARPEAWSDVVLDDSLHRAHNFDDRGGDLLVAGAEGILRRDAMNTDSDEAALLITPENSDPPTRGAGEARFGDGFIAAIEPMHGSDLVVYEEIPPGAPKRWRRTRLTGDLGQGHALATGDVLGLGSDQVVAGWREPDASGRVGIGLFFREKPGEAWRSILIADNTMACEDLKLADLDGDGRLDIVASGRATKNLVIYWNRGD